MQAPLYPPPPPMAKEQAIIEESYLCHRTPGPGSKKNTFFAPLPTEGHLRPDLGYQAVPRIENRRPDAKRRQDSYARGPISARTD